jgi:tRNA(adenine34) deaminase
MDYEFFMRKALQQAELALAAGEFPVGCVLVYEDEILVTGAREGTVGNAPNEIDHAEMIALRRFVKMSKEIDRSRATLLCTLEPCLMCYSALMLNGIGEIVYAYEDVMGGGTRCDLSRLAALYRNSSISIVPEVLRNESLRLFKTYFLNPENSYWQNSLLAKYTLDQ